DDSTSQCINQECRNPISKDKIIKDLSENKSRELVAVITTNSKVLGYEIATSEDKEKFEDSRKLLHQNWQFIIIVSFLFIIFQFYSSINPLFHIKSNFGPYLIRMKKMFECIVIDS
ncbi:MAG: hypothetical protein WAK17_18175, partial [Candidatus Nitrosopolaris sp.]